MEARIFLSWEQTKFITDKLNDLKAGHPSNPDTATPEGWRQSSAYCQGIDDCVSMIKKISGGIVT